MLDYLKALDLYLLHFLNVELAYLQLDQFWLTITQLHKQDWVRMFILPVLLGWLFYIYRAQSFKLIISVALAVGLADALAYRGLKSVIQRQRPFQNSEISWVRKVGEAHGPSFPSNHATNSFAVATVLAWHFPGVAYLFYILAALVALSRVALGVHYPSDIVAGMILGLFVGFVIRIGILNQVKWFRMRRTVSSKDGIFVDESARLRRRL